MQDNLINQNVKGLTFSRCDKDGVGSNQPLSMRGAKGQLKEGDGFRGLIGVLREAKPSTPPWDLNPELWRRR